MTGCWRILHLNTEQQLLSLFGAKGGGERKGEGGGEGKDCAGEKSLVADGERHVHEHAAALKVPKTRMHMCGSDDCL